MLVLFIGSDYASAGGIAAVVCISLPLAAGIRVMNGAIAGVGKPFLSAGVVAAGLVGNMLVSYVLVGWLAEYAAAWGLVVGQLTSFLFYP